MQPIPEHLRPKIDPLPTKAAKIRALDERGFARADIARFLDIRYQHVRNVLERSRAKQPDERAEDGGAHTAGIGSTAPAQFAVGADGRIVIPVDMRAAMQIGADGKVTARVVDGELRVIAPAVAIRRAQEMVRNAIPSGASLADELIAERRAEAHLEDTK
jgi:bifunctional DNA-binding transcriptional regulator/antitoxin component of YhaV-PrlF toxin-antitoxin module